MTLVWSPGFTQWDPAAITTALWLDAADASTVTTVSGAVSQWNDKSGNGRTFSQSTVAARPTLTAAGLNGRNVVTFGSTLFIGAATASDWGFMHGSQSSVIGVAAPSSTVDPGANAQMIGTRSAGLTAGIQVLYVDLSPSNNNFRYRSIRNIAPQSAIEALTGDNTHPAANTATLYSILSDPTNATATNRSSIRFNGGSSIATNTETPSPSSPFTAPQFALRLGNEAESSFSGYWAELVVTSDLTSTDTRQRIEGYLAHKWGLTANLPNDHPYRWMPPTLGT
jgi:hypothetical protein